MRAASAHNRPAVLPGVFHVLGARQPPPPSGALCAEDQVDTLGGGISSARGAAGGARHVSIIATIVFLVSADLREVFCTSENRAFATELPGLDLCFLRWLDGWVGRHCVGGGG